jgi:ketosteroid isomerase-like protein
MKKIALLGLSLVLMTSCAVSIGNTKKTPSPPAPEKIIEVDREVGYLKTSNKTYTASSGDNSVVELWDQYIEAHNQRDIDAIMEMESDSIQIWGPNGEYIKGKEAHAGFLAAWFSGANPKWNTFFSFPMKVNDMEDQKDGQWVVTGAQVKMTVEGEDMALIHLSDIYFENGKVNKFYVYQRVSPPKQ